MKLYSRKCASKAMFENDRPSMDVGLLIGECNTWADFFFFFCIV